MAVSGLLVVALFILAVIIVVLFSSACLVSQGSEWIVERMGKYLRTLTPGLSLVVPFVDKVAYKVPTKDIILDVQEQEVITRDNAVIVTNAIAFIKVTDPVRAVYGISNYQSAIRNLVMTTLRSIIGEMELDEALSSRDRIKARLRESISDEALDWGISVKTVEIQDIKPSESMQRAMEMQAAAERERKAQVTRAEGAKQAAILEAEARFESAKRDANAQVALATSSAESIRRVTEAIGDHQTPMMFILGEKYIKALENLSNSDNSKMIVLPADIQEALKRFVGARTGA